MNDETFVNGINYMISEGIIDIPIAPNVSINPDEKEELVVEEEIFEIPTWIKNNAGWWSDDAIGDETFVECIQYLVEQGIIDV
jgi:hypothetical protein